jgi:hypothetical protein
MPSFADTTPKPPSKPEPEKLRTGERRGCHGRVVVAIKAGPPGWRERRNAAQGRQKRARRVNRRRK